MITYADFAKLEIKIGTILAADVVPKSDRLLQLRVDVGEETPRQIVSGIREFFSDPQILVGKQCPFLTNLEMRVIHGLESQGMILAASANDVFALLDPVQPLPPGTLVR
jgi:methionyl-tRNA synthetase